MKKKLILAVILVLSFSSCSKTKDVEDPNIYTPTPIAFDSRAEESEDKTRAKEMTSVWIDGTEIGVFAHWQKATGDVIASFEDGNFTPDLFVNNAVTYSTSTSTSTWSYSPLKYWPSGLNDRVTYLAYHPYRASDATNITGVTGVPSVVSSGTIVPVVKGAVKIPFKVDGTPGNQEDLLWAVIKDASKANQDGSTEGGGTKTKFAFKHALSKAMFKAKLGGEYPGATVTITKITVLGADMEGDFYVNPALTAGTWKTTTSATPTPLVVMEEDKEVADAEGTPLDDYDILMIPQTNEGVSIELEWKISYINPTETFTESKTFALPAAWEQENAYTYTFVINLTAITFDASVTNWTENLNINGELSN